MDGDTIDLLADVDLTKAISLKGETVTLLGNGHSLTMKNAREGTFIYLSANAELNLGQPDDTDKSSLILDGQDRMDATRSMVYVAAGSTLNMYDGVVLKNAGGPGGSGSSCLVSYGTFRMYGGEISKNYNQILGIGGAVFFIRGNAGNFGRKNSLKTVRRRFAVRLRRGIYAADCAVSIANCEFSGNTIIGEKKRSMAVRSCSMSRAGRLRYQTVGLQEIMHRLGAIYIGGTADAPAMLKIDSTVFSENKGLLGGAITAVHADVTADATVITQNTAAEVGGGIFLQGASKLDMRNTTAIFGNTAETAADDIYASRQ